MPKYDVDTPFGNFEVESERELTNEEVIAAVREQGGITDIPESGKAVGQPEKAGPINPNYPTDFPDPTGMLNFLSRMGRRTAEAGQAAAEIPESALGVITGGKRGRLEAALRLMQGAFSPMSVVLSPLSAGVEQATESAGLTPEQAAAVGSVSEIPATLGLGMAAAAGKVGTLGKELATALGVGRPRTLAEAVKHDPQLRFVLQQPEAKGAITELEAAARRPDVTTAQLLEIAAGKSKGGPIAEAALKQKDLAVEEWRELAKLNNIRGPAPEAATFEGAGSVTFETPNANSLGFFRTIGTPVTQAAGIGDSAAAPAMEMQLASARIGSAVSARHNRNITGLTGISPEEIAKGLEQWDELKRPLADILGDSNLKTGVKKAAQYMSQKWNVDLQIAIPRLRESLRSRFERQIKAVAEKPVEGAPGAEISTAELNSRVDEALKARIPDDWGVRNYFTHTWPGEFLIKDAKGVVYGSEDSKIAAKFKIWELVSEDSSLKGKLIAEKKSFFDSNSLRQYKDRVRATINSVDEGMTLGKEEVRLAEEGKFAGPAAQKFMPEFQKRGKSSGYSNDLLAVMNLYDNHFERWLQLTDLAKKVKPQIAELAARGQTSLATMLDENLKLLWGYRGPLIQEIDNTISATPLLRNILPGNAAQRLISGVRQGIVAGYLRWSPKFHGLNATQLISTLWPIIDSFGDIVKGFKLRGSELGQQILSRHGVRGFGTKLEEFGKRLGPEESMNQEVAFLTMYNKGRKLGLSDAQSANYAVLRGNFYSQFLGALVDQPTRFRRLDPTGLAFMFQRFPIKQAEMMIDLVKDRNFPGAAKWFTSMLLLGGMRAATFGGAGWLGLKAYKEIEKQFGTEVADVVNVGLPGLAGIDVSGSMQLYNPPYGDSIAEKIGNVAVGPAGNLVLSTVGAAVTAGAPEPSAAKRAFNTFVQRVPALKAIDAARRLFDRDYDIKDPQGRLRFKAETKDLVKMLFAAKPLIREGAKTGPDLDTMIDALLDVETQRDSVLDYAASRMGQATLAGVDLPKEMLDAIYKDIDAWNAMMPEFPISGIDISDRAQRRQQAGMQTLRERLLRQAPAILRRSGEFSQPAIPEGGG